MFLVVTVDLTEADFQTRETTNPRGNIIPAKVSFNTALKNGIDLMFTPLTYKQFYARGFQLPAVFPNHDAEASSMYIIIIMLPCL